MQLKSKALLLLFIALLPSLVFSQKYSFKNFSIEQGLPQAYVYSMFQNPDGYLVVSTGKGTVLFNGSNFKPLPAPTLAPEDFVTASAIDQNGNSWFGCFSGNIYVCSSNNETKLVHKANGLISHFSENQNGRIVAGTRGNGLIAIDNLNFSAKEICKECSDYQINTSAFINRNDLIIGSSNGLLLYSFTTQKMQALSLLNNAEINYICKSNQAYDLWIGTKERGLFQVRHDESLQLSLIRNITDENGLSGNNVQCIIESNILHACNPQFFSFI